MQRPKGPSGPKKGTFSCPDDDFKSVWPLLAQGMCDCWWDDGKPRDPWSLKINFSGDQCVVTLTDKEHKLVCFTAAAGMKDCFDAIETALAGDGLSWRKSKF